MRKTLIAASSAAALLAPLDASAQEVTLALSHWVPPVHALQPTGMEPWAQSINEASDGRIQIDIYPSQQLGAAPDHYDMARDGIVDIGFVNPGYQAGRFPIIAAAELPFLVSNATTASRALHEWYQDYEATEMGDVKVCLVHLHDPGTFHGSSGPIAGPEDLAGKNVRPPQGTIARMISLAGGSPVQVPVPEMREILSSGGADMTVGPWNSIILFRVDDVVTHHLDLPLYSVAFVYAINQGTWDSLSDENRAVMEEHCTPEWSQKISTGWAEVESGSYPDIASREDHTLYTPNDEQMAAWNALSDQLREEWYVSAAEAGIEDPQAALQDLMDRLAEYGGAFEQ